MTVGDNPHKVVRWGAGEILFAGDKYTTIAGSTFQAAPVGIGAFLVAGARYIIFWEQGGNESLFQTKLESDYTHDSSRKVIIAEVTVAAEPDFSAGEKVQIDYKEVAGVEQKLNASSFNDTLMLKAREGSAALPSYSFGTDPDTGMYSSTADQVHFATNGVERLEVSSAGITVTGTEIIISSLGVQVTPTSTGTAEAARAAPVYSFIGDTDTGMYRHVSYGDLLGFSVGAAGFSVQERQASTGTYYLSLYAEGANDGTVGDPFFNIGSYVSEPAGTAYQPYPINTIDCNYYYAAHDGGVGNPPFTRWTDGDTGMYFPTANGLGLTAGGIGILNIWSAAGTPNTGGAYPPTTGLFDLGHPSYKWKDVYVEISNVSGAGDNVNVTTGGLLVRDSSSIRYKTNIKPLALDTSKLSKLRPVSFDYIYDNASNIGLIAEEVNEVLPELVNYNTEGQPESIRFNGLTVMLLEKVKELENEIQKLKEKD